MCLNRTLLIAAVCAAAGLASTSAQAAQPNALIYGYGSGQQTAQTAQTASTFVLKEVPGTDEMRRVYNFDSLDTNHDGLLSRAELPHAMRPLRAYFLEADWDGNAKLSQRELWYYFHDTAPMYAGVDHKLIMIYTY